MTFSICTSFVAPELMPVRSTVRRVAFSLIVRFPSAFSVAGWQRLNADNCDLLITEHNLPGLTRVERIRKPRAAHRALPIAMTALRLPAHERARNPSLQLAAMRVKPVAVDALLDAVKNALRATVGACHQIEPLPIWGSQSPADGLRR